MKYKSMSIKKAVSEIEEKELLLPHIQRAFVWKQDRNHNQVKKFFDSIMRGYPFGTFLFWITKDDIKIRKFIENYYEDMDIRGTFLKSGEFKNKKKTLVLDGQQRLQALYLALKGTYNSKELYFDVLSGDRTFYDKQDEFKFDFDYFSKSEINESNGDRNRKENKFWTLLKDIVLSSESSVQVRRRILQQMEPFFNKNEVEERVDSNISEIRHLFAENEIIYYFPIDSTDDENTNYEEVLEIFIRTNSGGTVLTKSDLMFSLIKLSWENADEEFEQLLNSINQRGLYNFDKDFILKTALVLIEKGARYEVTKFRGDTGNRNLNLIKANWAKLKISFDWLRDFLSDAGLASDGVLPSYNALIPIIYYVFRYENKVFSPKVKHNIRIWLYKSLLNGHFSGQSDRVIDVSTNVIKKDSSNEYFPYFELENSFTNRLNRNIEVLPNIIDGNVNLVLSLVYMTKNKKVDFVPRLKGNKPEVDHIFPRSIMMGRKYNYDRSVVNNTGNYMLLGKHLNIQKTNRMPEEYFKEAINEQKNFLEINLIPDYKRLHKSEHFLEFVEKRREALFGVIQHLLKYRDQSDQRPSLKSKDKGRGEDEGLVELNREEIYSYLDGYRAGPRWTYLFFQVLSKADRLLHRDELIERIDEMIGYQFSSSKLAGVLAGLTYRVNKKRIERIEITTEDGWKFSLKGKYKNILKDYYKNTPDKY